MMLEAERGLTIFDVEGNKRFQEGV